MPSAGLAIYYYMAQKTAKSTKVARINYLNQDEDLKAINIGARIAS